MKRFIPYIFPGNRINDILFVDRLNNSGKKQNSVNEIFNLNSFIFVFSKVFQTKVQNNSCQLKTIERYVEFSLQ